MSSLNGLDVFDFVNELILLRVARAGNPGSHTKSMEFTEAHSCSLKHLHNYYIEECAFGSV